MYIKGLILISEPSKKDSGLYPLLAMALIQLLYKSIGILAVSSHSCLDQAQGKQEQSERDATNGEIYKEKRKKKIRQHVVGASKKALQEYSINQTMFLCLQFI